MTKFARINISVNSLGAAGAGFARVLHLAEHAAFAPRWRAYSGMDGVQADFALGTAAYAAANTAFLQDSPRPKDILIGRRTPGATPQVETLTVGAIVAGRSTIKLGQDTIDLDVVAADTIATARASLLALLQASDWPFTFAAGGAADEITATANWAGHAYTFTGGGILSSATTTPAVGSVETIATALDAIKASGADFYGVTIESRLPADITAARAWCETNEREFFGMTDAADVADPAIDTDPASVAKGVSSEALYVGWHHKPWLFPEVSLAAAFLAVDMDTNATTPNFRILPGIPPTPPEILTATVLEALQNKNVWHYAQVGIDGKGTFGGKVSSGEWLAVVTFKAFLSARLGERLFGVAQSQAQAQSKIGYDTSGLGLVSAAIRGVLSDSEDAGHVDAGFTVGVPRLEDTDPADREGGELPGVTFNARLTGAVNNIDVQGVLTF